MRHGSIAYARGPSMKVLAALFLFSVPLLAHGRTGIWAKGSEALADHGDFATWQAPGNEASIHLGEGTSRREIAEEGKGPSIRLRLFERDVRGVA